MNESLLCLTFTPLQAYEVALSQIRDNREAIDRITESLIEKETITGEEFRTMLSQYTSIPAENLEAAAAAYKTPQVAVAAAAATIDIEL